MKYSNDILKNKKILVTRLADQAQIFSEQLQALGAQTREIPLIRVLPPESFRDFDNAFAGEIIFDWIFFASQNAVVATMKRLQETGQLVKLQNHKLAAIGTATSEVLKNYGYEAHFCPKEFVAEKVVEEFPGYPHLSGCSILWPKTSIGRTYVADELRLAGARVVCVCCYQTVGPENLVQTGKILLDILTRHEVDIITFTSSETVKQFQIACSTALNDEKKMNQDQSTRWLITILKNVQLAVIGPQTAKTCKTLLGKVDTQAREFTMEGLVNAIVHNQVASAKTESGGHFQTDSRSRSSSKPWFRVP